MATTYSSGVVTAYGAAVQAGYTGTYEQFSAALAALPEEVATLRGMSAIANTLAAGADATASYDHSTGVLSLGIPKGIPGDVANLAPAYDPDNGTYSVGQYCIEDGYFRRCIVPIDTPEPFTAAHWITVDVGGELERLNAGVDVLFDFHKTSLTWGEIVALIDGGEMSEIFPVASQIKDVWKNTSDSSVEFPWDIVHYSQNGDTWLKLHYAAPETLQFDAPEAIYYFDGTEPAGTYHIPIGSTYGTGWVVGHSIQFTLTAAPDEGDQLFIDCGTNYANDPAGGRAWMVYDAGGTTVKQSGTTSEGTGGTSLGTIGNVNAHRTNGRLNAISRVVYGYARWSQSAMRQYFNSADVNWWAMKNPWDRPPAQASTIRGFLCGFSQDFLDHLEETEVVTALNTQEGFAEATETTLDKIFLPSLEQMYINPQLAGVEGESWDYYKALAEEAGLPGKFQQYQTYPILISYNASNTSSAVYVFLRSCGRGTANNEWFVYTSGAVVNNTASNAPRGCPACKFKKSAQS